MCLLKDLWISSLGKIYKVFVLGAVDVMRQWEGGVYDIQGVSFRRCGYHASLGGWSYDIQGVCFRGCSGGSLSACREASLSVLCAGSQGACFRRLCRWEDGAKVPVLGPMDIMCHTVRVLHMISKVSVLGALETGGTERAVPMISKVLDFGAVDSMCHWEGGAYH